MGRNFKKDNKMFEMYSLFTVYCPCGHSVAIPNKVDRVLCTWCGKWVYKNKQTEFRYKLQEQLKKQKKSEVK